MLGLHMIQSESSRGSLVLDWTRVCSRREKKDMGINVIFDLSICYIIFKMPVKRLIEKADVIGLRRINKSS
jgi:hypothetical protein